jgi:cell division septation protein DedD
MRRPMRSVVAVLLAAALGVSSAFLVACGDRNSLIPKGDAAAMQSDLDRASQFYDQEECRRAQAAVRSASGRAQRLPSGVDADLRATLRDNLDTVLERIVEKCGKTKTNTTPTQTQTTATTPTETTQTTTETTTTETTTEPPPTQTETVPEPAPGGSGGTTTP